VHENQVEIYLLATSYKEKKFTQTNAAIQKSVIKLTLQDVAIPRNIKQSCELMFTDFDKLDIVGFFIQRSHNVLVVYDNAQVMTLDQKQNERVQIKFPFDGVRTS
jgi:hypothetical protein